MSTKANMDAARARKDDEFYTREQDIEEELSHYPDETWRGKAIHCNCDDPRWSSFATFFRREFRNLGLSRLVVTHYSEPQRDLLAPPQPPPVMLDWDGTGKPVIRRMAGSGSFEDYEVLRLTRQCDIVVTNPPFSLFRRFVDTLEWVGVHYLIIGNLAGCVYSNIWPLMKSGRLRFGAKNKPMWFHVNSAGGEERCVNSRWYTTLHHTFRRPGVPLDVDFCEELHPEYENYFANEVSKTKHIPGDHDGILGVPLTYMDKHDPDQFDLVGCSLEGIGRGIDHLIKPECNLPSQIPIVHGDEKFARIFIRRRRP